MISDYSFEGVKVKKISSLEEINLAHQIRIEVFVHEQECPIEEEIDEIDPKCTHFLLYNIKDSKALGTARLVHPSDSKECHLGRLAIIKEARGFGFGKLLVDAVHKEAALQGYTSSSIHGQSYARKFYEKMGYNVDENDPEEFLECGIKHLKMICRFI